MNTRLDLFILLSVAADSSLSAMPVSSFRIMPPQAVADTIQQKKVLIKNVRKLVLQ